MEDDSTPLYDEEKSFEYESFAEFLAAAEDGELPRAFRRDLATVDSFMSEAYAAKRELYDETIEVTHTSSSARVRMNINRGTGVRDQDEITGEVKARTPDELLTRLPHFTTMLTHQMEQLRQFQPDEGSDEE